MQLSITLLAAALLVSAFKDVFWELGRIVLPERDVESIAGPVNNNLGLNFGPYDS